MRAMWTRLNLKLEDPKVEVSECPDLLVRNARDTLSTPAPFQATSCAWRRCIPNRECVPG